MALSKPHQRQPVIVLADPAITNVDMIRPTLTWARGAKPGMTLDQWLRSLSDDRLLEEYQRAKGLPSRRAAIKSELWRRNINDQRHIRRRDRLDGR